MRWPVRLRFVLPVCVLPFLACTYEPGYLAPYEPPAGGTIKIQVTMTQPHTGLTLAWSGRWLRDEDVSDSTGAELAADSRAPENTAALQLISFNESVALRAGWWEFTITGSVGDSDVFVPIVCRQKIFSGKSGNESVVLEALEGSINCTARDGYENPKVFLWGEMAGTIANGVLPSRSEVFPDVADNTGSLRLLFFLVKRDTLPEQVSDLRAGFYCDINQPGPPNCQPGPPTGAGMRIGSSFPLQVQQKLAARGRIDTTTTPSTLKGDTWVWFDLLEENLTSPVDVQQGQILYLGLLDRCPPGPQPCDTTTRVFHFYSTNTDVAGPNVASPNVGETDLPSPWPAGGTPFSGSAPAVVFGLSRP